MPAENILRKILSLELEEKILNGSALIALLCTFFPWVGGEWLGRPVTYSGLGFFTSFIGVLLVLLHATTLLLTIIPLLGKSPIVSKKNRDTLRLIISGQTVVLTIAAWSVLTEFTFEFSRLEIHFGLYGTLIGSLVATLYSFLKFQEQRRKSLEPLFTHDGTMMDSNSGAPPVDHIPPPPTGEPEDFRLRP